MLKEETKMRVVSQYAKDEYSAGPKAKVDIEQILHDTYGAKCFSLLLPKNPDTVLFKLRKLCFLKRVLDTTDDIVVIQAPLTKKANLLNRAKYKIAIIHDINTLRSNEKNIPKAEIDALNMCDFVIAHNDAMIKLLMHRGLKTNCYPIGLFDYLAKGENKKNKHNKKIIEPVIVYPGNLSCERAAFMYSLEELKMDFRLRVYGSGLEKIDNNKISDEGSFSPDQIVNRLEGDLGLVWTGEIIPDIQNYETFYNQYNTPHKLSCFLAAGLPVIVWEGSAVAEIVKKYDIGYTISNLYDINKLDFSDYQQKCKNVEKISDMVRTGYFTKKAIFTALARLKLN